MFVIAKPTKSYIIFYNSVLSLTFKLSILLSFQSARWYDRNYYFLNFIIQMLQNQSEYQYLFKVVLVGNSCVGKSSIVVRYSDDEFSQVFLATIGVDFRFKSFQLNSNKIKLQIWDTAGHQRFRTITSSYYRGAHALMIVFDITDKQSFQDATKYWYGQIRSSCPPETQILLVGNKCDLQTSRTITIQDNHREIQYIQTSAKTAEHIEQAFHKIAGMLVQTQKKAAASKDSKRSNRKSTTGSEAVVQGQPTKLHKPEPNTTSSYCCYTS